jgi:hypothetical protein
MPSQIGKCLRSSRSNPGLAKVTHDLAQLMSPSNKQPIKQERRKSLDGIRHSADPAALADDPDGKGQGKGKGNDSKKEKKLPKGYVYEALGPKAGTGRSGKDAQCEGDWTTQLEEYESEATKIDK